MIYQCYHKAEGRDRLFTAYPYRGFGLEPSVNDKLLRRCPELADEPVRAYFNEYGAMVHIWRNRPFDWQTWIGFTSYRQIDKTPFRFSTRREIQNALRQSQIAGWGFHDVSNFRSDGLTGAAAQLELCHPGGFAYFARILAEFRLSVPARFQTDQWVLYASYWIMRKKLFYDFMRFSWPIVQRMLETRREHDFVSTDRRSIGYIIERLFIVWYMQNNFSMLRLGPQPRA